MENKTLNELVIKYKQTKDSQTLNKIFSMLKKTIHDKATYIYYRKYFPFSLYYKCLSCQRCLNKGISCEECTDCSCEKGTFNLNKTKLVDLEDVEQDMCLLILSLINNFDINKDFSNYLSSSMWNWIPSFITLSFVKRIKNELNTLEDTPDSELTDMRTINELNLKFKIEELKSKITDDISKKILYNLLQDNNLTQSDLAKKLGVTQQYISLKITEIKKLIHDTCKND